MMIATTHQNKLGKKHFTYERPFQKTKYNNKNTKPNKFMSQIKLMNLEIRIKKYINHELLNTNKIIYEYVLDNSTRRNPEQ